MSNETEIARELMLNLLRKGRFSAEFTTNAPIVWKPERVRDCRPNQYFDNFTRYSCWEYIEEILASGHEIEIITMDKPPGSKDMS